MSPLLSWRQATVIATEDACVNTRRFWLSIPDVDVFHFAPGQFITLDLPTHEKATKRWKSYSIANGPNDTAIVELVITLANQGLGSTWLFKHAKIGTALTFRGPQGVFTLRESDLENELFLICTGTGIAPFRSMLQYIDRNNLPFKKINLIFGCRTQPELLYRAEMEALANKYPNFHYYPTLSRQQWEGHTGYMHPLYEKITADMPEANFYICGWKDMIDEAKVNLMAKGYAKANIRMELYG